MSQMEIDRVLAQIRSLSTQLQPKAAQPPTTQTSVSLRALTEVRDRLVSAYTDIMNMQM
jgi:hypothetical protein